MNATTSEPEITNTPSRIPAAEMVGRIATEGAHRVLDIRTTAEVKSEHLEGSRHIPLDELRKRIDEVRSLSGPIYLMCRSGKRAIAAQEILVEADVHDSVVIDGGMLAFAEAGGQTKSNASHMSLERQVRIAAGTFVLLGVGLGAFVHEGFFGLAGFVGAGLVFAGLTDTCGMGMLLAKMPWNRGH